MKTIQRVFAVLLCIVIGFSLCPSVFATNNTAKINVSSVDAMPGDTVTISVNISENPGIMSMAFSITYDNTVLVYKSYSKGYLSSYTVLDHPDKGHVSFVNVETKDVATNGTIISLLFEVKKDAKPGKSVVSLASHNRATQGTKLDKSFSNSKQEFVLPAVTSGGVNVAETCENAGHSYSEWEIIRENSCTDSGLKSRVCSRCNYTQEKEIPAAHKFESDWTIDKAATPEEDGIMSRHCTECDAKTDEFTFKYEEIGETETPDDTTSDENSSTDSEVSDTTDSEMTDSGTSDTSSNDTAATEKPNINNVVGEKVPQQEAEKFEEYQPPKPEEETPEEDDVVEDEITSSDDSTDSSNVTTGVVTDKITGNPNEETSFFSTTGGIVMLIILIVLSVGILALGVMVIIRKQKEQ